MDNFNLLTEQFFETLISSDYHGIIKKINKLERKSNYQRLFYLLLLRSFMNVYVFATSTQSFPIARGIIISLIYLGYEPLVKKTKELNQQQFNEFLKTEFSIFEKQIQNNLIEHFPSNSKENKLQYEKYFEEFYDKNLAVWNCYTEAFYIYLKTISSIIEVNLLPIIENKSFNAFTIILANSYLYLYYLNLSYHKKKRSEILSKDLTKEKTRMKTSIKDIFENTNIINEFDNLELHTTDFKSILINISNIMVKSEFNLPYFLTSTHTSFNENNFILSFLYSILCKDGYALSITRSRVDDLDNLFNLFHKFSNSLENYIHLHNFNNQTINCNLDKRIFNNDQKILFNIKNMCLKFGDVTIFKNINIIIPRFKWISLNGFSGCGKTTFMKVLLKLIQSSSGSISYLNEFDNYSYNNLKSQIHFVNSDSDIFDKSILYNCSYGIDDPASLISYKIKILLKKFGMEEYCDNLDFDCRYLSFGQRQRIRIIRLILSERKIWFLDEVTSNLNLEMEEHILNILKEIQIAQNISVIHISHNPKNIKFADHSIYINKDGMSLHPI